MKREGRVLHYLWGPGATGDEFNFVHQIEFGDEDIRNIRLSALTGRQPCDVDVRLIDLKVRSAGSATTEARTNRWLVAAAVLMGVGLFVTLGVWLSNSRGGTVAPTLTTANDEPTVAAVVPEFITFACAGCGKKIVVKAEWAGKKGRCVHCHREMVVPTSQGDQPSAAPTTVQDDAPADGVPQPSASRLARTPIVPGALILVAVGALGTAAAVWFASAPGTAAATTAAQTEFYHSFKDNPAASRGFEFVGPGAERFVRYEPDGVRITLPAGLAGERPMTGIATPMGVRGDFEITASFEILREPATEDTGESGTRLSLGIFQDTPRANVASVTRSVGAKVGPAFVAWESLWNDETGKPDKKSKVVPTDAMAGRLRLVRTGSVLSYYVAKDSDRDFTLLQQYAFGTADLKEVRVTTSTGGPRAALDVRFTDLRVRAAALPYIPGAETPLRSWRGPVLVGAAAAVALALGAWLVVRRNSVRTVVAALILVLWTTASVCAEEEAHHRLPRRQPSRAVHEALRRRRRVAGQGGRPGPAVQPAGWPSQGPARDRPGIAATDPRQFPNRARLRAAGGRRSGPRGGGGASNAYRVRLAGADDGDVDAAAEATRPGQGEALSDGQPPRGDVWRVQDRPRPRRQGKI